MKKKSLIVDDNQQNLYLLQTLLESNGFEVLQATNGSIALDLARRNKPDIIISDILMPVMDGFTLCNEWMKDPALASVPFVFYTATYTQPADEDFALALGAAKFIIKPLQPEEFLHEISEVLEGFRHDKIKQNKPIADEYTHYKLYSSVLVRKLETKMADLELTKTELEAEIEIRRRAEKKLRLHSKVFEYAKEGILIMDNEGSILSANQAFLDLSGFEIEHVLGHSLLKDSVLKIHGKFESQELPGLLAKSEQWQGEITITNKDGHSVPAWMTLSGLRDKDEADFDSFIAIFLDISLQKAQSAQIDRLAFFDKVTGLPNRALLIDRIGQLLNNPASGKLFFLLVNVDRFREINQAHGHSVGDSFLREITRRFQETIQSGVLARFGGDEFALVQEGTGNDAADLAEQLKSSLLKPIQIRDITLVAEISIGIAIHPDDATTISKLIQLGGLAMNRAKMSGNSPLFFTDEMSHEIVKRMKMTQKLKKEIENEGFEIFLQPQFSLNDNALAGAEVLLRWHTEEWGWVSPGDFIPIAESTKQIIGLGKLIFARTCDLIKSWQRQSLPVPPKVAVNISAYQLEEESVAADFRSICESRDLSPEMFELELTESAIMRDPETAIQALAQLHESGFSLAIDDFGVAYSSLTYLKRFAAQKLKIDMSFVQEIIESSNDRAIVSAIIGIAKSLGMRTLAEGVEQKEQAEILRSLGCDDVQGFLYGKPIPADLFTDTWLAGKSSKT